MRRALAAHVLTSNPAQFGIQCVATLVAIAWSGALTFGLLKAIGAVVALRPSLREEGLGLDVSQHGEEAYARDEGAILILSETSPAPLPTTALAAATEAGQA